MKPKVPLLTALCVLLLAATSPAFSATMVAPASQPTACSGPTGRLYNPSPAATLNVDSSDVQALLACGYEMANATNGGGQKGRTGGQAIAQCRSRPIDLFLLSDSNTEHFNGGNTPPDMQSGWDAGLQYALWQYCGLYTTPMVSMTENSNSGFQFRGWMTGGISSMAFTGAGGASEQYDPYLGFPTNHSYAYQASGAVTTEPDVLFDSGAVSGTTGATISGNTLTVSSMSGGYGVFAPGGTISCGGCTAATITGYGPSTVGGVGTYPISGPPQTVGATQVTETGGGPWNFAHHWRFWFAYGTFSASTGSFQPYVRHDDTGFQTRASYAVNITGGTGGVSSTTLTVTNTTGGLTIKPGLVITGTGVSGTVSIVNQLTFASTCGGGASPCPTGTEGTYTLSSAQTIASPTALTGILGTNDGIGNNLKIDWLDMPAGTVSTDIELGFRPGTASTTPVGPYVGYYVRAEDATLNAGAALHTVYSVGGMGLWEYARNLIVNTPDQQIWMFMNEARRLQVLRGQVPIVVIVVNSGVNDRNYCSTTGTCSGDPHATSWGPTGGNGIGNSSANYIDNLNGIVNRIESVYARYWPISEVSWVIMPSHPQSTPDDANLLAYRSAVVQWVAQHPRTSYIDLNALEGFNTANAAGWIDNGGGPHASNLGYYGWGQLAINDVVTR